jgi:PEP-CTERM motif
MKLPAIAAALALALPLTTHAAATATAQFGNFHIEIIDLDLNDGIDAAIELEESVSILAAYQPNDNTEPDPFNYLHAEGTVDASVAGAQSSATLLGGAGSASASFGAAQGDMLAGVSMGSLFKLTANTKMILTVDAAVNAMDDGANYGQGYVHLYISDQDLPFVVDENTRWDNLLSDVDGNAARQLTLSLTTGEFGTDGNFAVVAGAVTGVSPVPEPSQYAMFGLGIAGLGWRLRRARRMGAAAGK